VQGDIIGSMKSTIVSLAVAAFTALPGPAQQAGPGNKPGHHNISATVARELVSRLTREKKSIVILDVRTAKEYAQAHIPGAKLMDFLTDDFKTALGKLDRTKVYLLHCRSGSRSSAAFATMKRLGFKSVYHLDGGIIAWKKAGGKTG
jgi:phage shock protein E